MSAKTFEELLIEKKSQREGEGYKGNQAKKSINGALVMLGLCALAEVWVVYYTSLFWAEQAKFPIVTAVSFAVIWEGFYMWLSTRKGLRESIFRLILLTVSVAIMSVTAYNRDEGIALIKSGWKDNIKELEERLVEIKEERKLFITDKKLSQDKEKGYVKREWYKKSETVLKDSKAETKDALIKLSKEKNAIRAMIKKEKQQQAESNIFSHFKAISFTTQATIIVFMVMQLVVCFFLPVIWADYKRVHKD